MKPGTLRHAFTLLEIMVTVSVVGMMASLSIPMWNKATETTQLNMCLATQRAVYDAAILYEFEQGRSLRGIRNNAVAISRRLFNTGYMRTRNIFECPSSSIVDYADYKLQYNGTELQKSFCDVQPSLHVTP